MNVQFAVIRIGQGRFLFAPCRNVATLTAKVSSRPMFPDVSKEVTLLR